MRLRYAYFITCTGVVRDAQTGEIIEIHCTYDPATRGGDAPDGRKVKATLHWVSARHAVPATVRLYERLFLNENPNDAEEGQDFLSNLNPNSLEALEGCYVEPGLRDAPAGSSYQFERQGYFCVDPDSEKGAAGFQPDGRLEERLSGSQGLSQAADGEFFGVKANEKHLLTIRKTTGPAVLY